MDIITIHHCPPLAGLVTALLCLITALLHLVTTLLHLVIALPCLADTITILPPLEGPIIALLCLVDPVAACPRPTGPLIALPCLMNLFVTPPLLWDFPPTCFLVLPYLFIPLHMFATPPLFLFHP